jgi:LmbE family N-acetylglucosaminyl deacetylase
MQVERSSPRTPRIASIRAMTEEISSGPLRPVSEDWSVALAIAAHPDDLEYGTSAAVAKWTSQGKRVVYCLVTSGEAGIDSMTPEEAGALREREQREAAEIAGVDTVEFLGYPDGMLEYGLPLRRDLARAIRRHRPEVVITGNYRDNWAGGGRNQADHICAGRAVIDAVRDAANRWVFRELLAEGLEPWAGVCMVLVAGSPVAEHGVDVSDHFDAGVRSLRAHTAYLAALDGGPLNDPARFLQGYAGMAGERMKSLYAVPFELLITG